MVYTVLARKYRPQKLSDLVGQETLVKVLTNSFKLNRIAHAFILTGSRGVGKTSTARIIAKGLNCENPTNKSAPTIDPCGACSSCASITEGCHIDVIEMDAASRTGVSDIREIIENVDYKTVSARFKVYIVDEVHMLSNSAFNALLKTLEEPPEHVKFVFATTEITKIPTTVISRCQRFDLTRIAASKISTHLEEICNKESISFSLDALSIISNAAEGSLRDALSILDQAIIHGEGTIKPESIMEMLGIADQKRSLILFEHIINQEQKNVLDELDKQFKSGIDPVSILNGLMEMISKVMIIKIKKENFLDQGLSEEVVKALLEMSKRISTDILSRLWQMALKSHEEIKYAPDAFSALQMAILRLSFFSGLPGPIDLMKQIADLRSSGKGFEDVNQNYKENMPAFTKGSISVEEKTGNPSEEFLVGGASPSEDVQNLQISQKEKKKVVFNNFDDLLSFLEKEKNVPLLVEIENHFKLISFKIGEIEFDLTEDASSTLVSEISKVLNTNSKFEWKFTRIQNDSAKTIAAQKEETRIVLDKKIEDNLVVKEIVKIFPGAKIGKSTFH